jgi:LuxR family transcriptional regulator, maltose regulon positive regulatory protein
MDHYRRKHGPSEESPARYRPSVVRWTPTADPADTEPTHTGDGSKSRFVTPAALSRREREVLRYVPSAMSAAEIGAELYVSVNTVKAHLRSIYRKLGVSRRRDAVIQAHRHGLL